MKVGQFGWGDRLQNRNEGEQRQINNINTKPDSKEDLQADTVIVPKIRPLSAVGYNYLLVKSVFASE